MLGLMKPRTSMLPVALILVACSPGDGSISAQITEKFEAGGSAPINLTQVGPPSWERVCVLGPYTTNEAAEQVLGFKWDVQSKSSIGSSDGINLLVFLKNQEVSAYTEHRRDKGDFLELKPRCIGRNQASLLSRVEASGWVQLVSQWRPNPSIEGTSTIRLRLLAAAPHVKR